jgi:hypothetical protein
MQVGRVATAVAVVAAVISGCGGPAQAGTAVFVGDRAVPLDRIQTQIDAALAKDDLVARFTAQGGTTADIARSIVSREVVHDLLTRRAAQEGIVVTDAQGDERIAQAGGPDALLDGSFFDLPALRDRMRDDMIAAEIARREAGGLAVTLDLVAATSQADAEAKAQTLAAGGPAADALFGDPRRSARGTTAQAVSVPDDASSPYFGSSVGSVVAFQPSPQQNTWVVFRVVDRRTDAPSDPAALDSISQDQLVAIGQRMLQADAEQVGVRVNPRYGVWDPIQLRVVAEDQQSGTILPPVAS